MMKKSASIILYLCIWFVWAAWEQFIMPMLPNGTLTTILHSTVVKALIWIAPFLLFRGQFKSKEFFRTPFPWLACVALLCVSAAFLHTLRIVNGLLHTYIFFDPMFLLFSLSAGVIEELSFRGGFLNLQEQEFGFWPAALINGAMFTLYHYPELLIGQWQALISLRSVLIFAMGVVFCWTYKKWRNLALNMTVHSVWNILSYLFCLAG